LVFSVAPRLGDGIDLGDAKISELSHRQLQLHSFAAVILSTLDSWTKSGFDEAPASNFFLNEHRRSEMICASMPFVSVVNFTKAISAAKAQAALR